MADQTTARRPTLQRVPPHDNGTENNLLGAAMLTPEAAGVVAELGADAFYSPRNQTIADTIARLAIAGHPCDPGTVAHHLRAAGQLDTIGGPATLTTLLAQCGPSTSAPHWAELTADLWHKRRILGMASEVVEAIYTGLPVSGIVAGMHDTAANAELVGHSTWEQINLQAILAGEGDPVTPAALLRTDGVPLLYAGKIHALNAEPEAGKSWVALLGCTQEIQGGRHVLYIDFEADAPDIAERLLALGLTVTQILTNFHYVRPDDPIDSAARARVTTLCEAFHPTVAVIDGVTEAMAGTGWMIKENNDIAAFFAALPRLISRTGAAVLLIDHVTKDKEDRGRWGIGGQHKTGGIDGAVYGLEATKAFSRNQAGTSRLIVAKDRHGHMRPHASGQQLMAPIGNIRFTPSEGAMTVAIDPPPGAGSDTGFRPTGYMERISKALEYGPALTGNQIIAAVRGKTATVSLALRILVHEGYVEATKQGQSIYHSNLRPFREEGDPGPTEPEQEQF